MSRFRLCALTLRPDLTPKSHSLAILFAARVADTQRSILGRSAPGSVGCAVLIELWDHGAHECKYRPSPRQELESVARAAAVPPALPGNDGRRIGRVAHGDGRHAGIARGAAPAHR